MHEESSEVPHAASPLLGRSVLVLAPHPDDELLGCGGVIAQNIAQNNVVSVFVITDGSGQGEASAREAEAIAGLEVLGCGPPTFLRLRDGSLSEDRDRLVRELGPAVLAAQPDLLLAPSPIEIHPDHAAVAEAVIALLQTEEAQSSLSASKLAFYEVSQPLRPNHLADISAVFERKLAAVRKHDSQQRVRDYAG